MFVTYITSRALSSFFAFDHQIIIAVVFMQTLGAAYDVYQDNVRTVLIYWIYKYQMNEFFQNCSFDRRYVALDPNGRRLRWPTAFSGSLRWLTAIWVSLRRPPIGHLGLGSKVHPGLKWPTHLKVWIWCSPDILQFNFWFSISTSTSKEC